MYLQMISLIVMLFYTLNVLAAFEVGNEVNFIDSKHGPQQGKITKISENKIYIQTKSGAVFEHAVDDSKVSLVTHNATPPGKVGNSDICPTKSNASTVSNSKVIDSTLQAVTKNLTYEA